MNRKEPDKAEASVKKKGNVIADGQGKQSESIVSQFIAQHSVAFKKARAVKTPRHLAAAR